MGSPVTLPTVTMSAEATNAAGKSIISHGPLTLNLTEMEEKIASKLLSPGARLPRTFEDVIGEDSGKLAKMLTAIKGAY